MARNNSSRLRARSSRRRGFRQTAFPRKVRAQDLGHGYQLMWRNLADIRVLEQFADINRLQRRYPVEACRFQVLANAGDHAAITDHMLDAEPLLDLPYPRADCRGVLPENTATGQPSSAHSKTICFLSSSRLSRPRGSTAPARRNIVQGSVPEVSVALLDPPRQQPIEQHLVTADRADTVPRLEVAVSGESALASLDSGLGTRATIAARSRTRLACQDPLETDQRRQVRTTNAIERRFREVRRRTRPMGAFQDRTSMDRILFAIFIHENKQQGISTLFPLTHKS